jgi:hypothetical protein
MSDLWLSQSDLNTLREMVEVDIMEDLYLNNNLLSFFSKVTPDGDPWKIPIRTSRTTAHGADDVGALAQLAGSSSAGRPNFGAFIVGFAQTVATSKVPQAAIAASMRKNTGVVPLLVDAVRDARQTVAQDIEQALGGNGYGAIGSFSSFTGSGPWVLQMATLASVVNINVGDLVVSAAAYNSSSLDVGVAQITDVDRDAATITVASVSGPWAGAVNGHVLFLALDKLAGNIGTPSKPFGLDAYIPVDPTARVATFQNLNRALDPQNLSGVLVNAAATDIVSGVNRALAKLGPKRDAAPKVAFMNDNMYAALQAQMFNKVRFTETEIEGSVNFEGIKFRTAKGELSAATSWAIPDNRIYVVSRDSFEIGNMLSGEIVQSATNNGKDFVDSYDSFGATIRQWGYLQLGCKAPGLSAVVSYS